MRYILFILLLLIVSCEYSSTSDDSMNIISSSSSSLTNATESSSSLASTPESSSSSSVPAANEIRPLLATPPTGKYYTIRFFGAQTDAPYGEIDTTFYAQGEGSINADWGDSSGYAGIVLVRDSTTYSKISSVSRTSSQTALVKLEVGEPLQTPAIATPGCRYVTGLRISSYDHGDYTEPDLTGYVKVSYLKSSLSHYPTIKPSGIYVSQCLSDSVFVLDSYTTRHNEFVDTISQSVYYKDLLSCKEFLIGAPNIYLYPQTTTQVSVRLESPSHDSILISVPDYAKGWNVTATPDGTIDGKYPFLYYEGSSIPSARSDSGWVLNGNTLSADFQRVLAGEGFQGREVTDFLEFWLPRLPHRAYWLMTPEPVEKHFLLHITPTPAELHRSLWTLRPLDAPITIAAPRQHPVRRDAGFVAVEWGMIVDPRLLLIPSP